MKTLLVLTCAVALVTLTNGVAAAETTAADFRLAVKNLDEAVAEADLQKVFADLAKFVKLDEPLVRKAMVEQQLPFSGVALAQLLAEKTRRKFEEVLEAHPKRDWLEACAKAQVSLSDAVERLEDLWAKVSFLTYEQQKKRKKKK
ncbi:MAG: hypothetical protein HYY24_10000 [Verrucomicrobia bacterium]|nr:hypothetical protein [Verrucomicrobiota bacterium]